MAKENMTSVLDIGSGKVCAAVASHSEGDDFKLLALVDNKISTFYDGQWIDEKEVKTQIATTIRQAENRSNSKISKLYVGVPSEFTAVLTRVGHLVFNSPKTVEQKDIEEIFDNANDFSDTEGYSLISRSSIYFILDDNKQIVDPVGENATKVSGLVSFVFVAETFKKLVLSVLRDIGIKNVEFVSSALAQSLYLLDPQTRDDYAILVDCGFVTTSVNLVLGDGILFAKVFPVGGGQIVDDISQVLSIDYDHAEAMKQKLHLSLEYDSEELIEINSMGIQVDAVKANEIAKCRVEDIADTINACLEGCKYEFPQNAPVLLTGGTFAHLKGGANHLSKCLKRQTTLVPLHSPTLDKQEYTSVYGVVNIALNQQNAKKPSFLKRLLGKFGG